MTFEEQFTKREYFQTPFGFLETVDLIPEHINDITPVMFALGWGESPELAKEVLKEIFQTGRRVFTIRHARKIQRAEREYNFPIAEMQKAETLLLFLKDKKVNKVDVITHSEGSINVSIAALENPQLFRNLIFVTPAGLIGSTLPIKIISGFLLHLLTTNAIAIVNANNTYKQNEKMITKDKLSSMWQEIVAISTVDICPLLLSLKRQEIHIGIIAGEKDTVFPAKKMKQHITSHIPGLIGDNVIFETKPGGHELYTNTHVIMKQVLGLLDKIPQ